MSLFDTFDPHSPAIVNPLDTHGPMEGFPETVIMTFQDKTFQVLEENFQPEVVYTLREGVDVPVYRLDWNGREIGIFRTLVGGAGTVGLLEEALALGAKKVLVYGSCGVLDAKLAAGHFILPTQAYRDEGTSYHYMPVSDYVDIPTAEHLGEIFDGLHLPYVKGRVWTTDGFFRETRNNMEKRRADGCIAVDMECASVMAAAQFRGVPVYQFIYAEDSLDGDTWDPRTMGKVPASAREKYLRVALEVASRL
ncbi:MAG: nucleoside phosphorylase [Oscillospiraceae bacterium]|nr:nucleoside phosphorylase [Oscillospiraceae bacterium]